MSLRDAVDRMFDPFWDPFSLISGDDGWSTSQYVPSIDISETDDEIQVVADVPGYDPKNIKVTVEDGVLIVQGEMKEEKEEKKKTYRCRQCSSGSFYRQIVLSDAAEYDKTKSSFKNGRLTVKIPKRTEDEKKGKVIDIEVED